jgi:hypothetical protein
MRSVKFMLAVALVCATAMVAAVTVADAHTWSPCVYHPSDPSYGCVDHNWMHVCDRDVDGHRVRLHYIVDWSQPVYYSGWAPSQGCHDQGDYYNIIQFRVCVEAEGCSAWKSQW